MSLRNSVAKRLLRLGIRLNKGNMANIERFIQELLYKSGIGSGSGVESSGERVVLSLLDKQDSIPCVIFDVGANVGKYTQMCVEFIESKQDSNNKAQHTGGGKMPLDSKAFQIHAFEPSIHTFKILESNTENLAQNPSKSTKQDSIISKILESKMLQITLNNCALGLRDETLTLYYNEIASGLSSLAKRRLEHFNIDFSMSENVQVTSLESYCAARGITHINLLKIDVEGFELNVLNGARAMFEQGKIDIVTFEFGGCNIDTRTFFQDFWYFFKEQKMQIYRILPNEKLYKIEHYKELYEQFVTTNYIAVREG